LPYHTLPNNSSGSGPSGLVAAKTLTHDHPKGVFHVTVFEKGDRIGGLWPTSKKDGGLVNPDMCTNQSMHTVSFSDHAWPEGTRAFPKAWEAGKYLEDYIEAYGGYDIRLGCRVENASLQGGSWKVQIRNKKASGLETLSFDHLIVTTGFFGKPKIPTVLEGLAAPVWHSSRLRSAEELLNANSNPSPGPRRNIVVVGGQMSGVETAASIALQISSEANSPGAKLIPNASEYTVAHVVQQPVWAMTLFFPNDPTIPGASPEQDTVSLPKHHISPYTDFIPAG
jgi:cation diffusion facilitator CzcD-associated flavoprotein CzcO